MRTRRSATLVGATALALWATLAWLTTETARIPAFELMALVFGISFGVAAVSGLVRGESLRSQLTWPRRTWLVGLAGLFGYHAFFFVALRTAPAAEANLINYLWPVLLAVFSAFLPGERLRWWHVAGCALGFAGASLLALSGGALSFEFTAWRGYASALACAIIWPTYSVLSRRMGQVATNAVGAFCGGTGLAAALLHFALEPSVAPTAREALAIAAMGVGPVGLALFAWDVGMKKGDVRALAAASYLEPLFSTLVLFAFGRAALSRLLVLSCGLIASGAVVGGWDALRPRATARE